MMIPPLWLRYLSVIYCLLCVSCNSTINIHIDSSVTPGKYAAIRRSMEDWDQYASEPLVLAPFGWEVRLEPLVRPTIGLTRHVEKTVTIDPALTDELTRKVSLHELGHVMGLSHVVGGPAIMNPTVTENSDITSLDLAMCRSVGSCD